MHIDKQKQNNILRLVLFDIDQTLINGGGAGREALYRALQEALQLDVNKIESANIKMSGKTDPEIIKEFIQIGAPGIKEHDWQQTINKTLELYLQFLPQTLDEAVKGPRYFLHEGVNELLAVLQKDKEVALGLLTGNIESGARLKLGRFDLNHYFPIGAYGCDSANRLDLPAIAHRRAQEYYKTTWLPRQIIIIGDARNDILCAKHYGATSLVVNTGTTSWRELKELEPHYIFPSLKETDQILNAIMAEPV